MLKVTNFEDTFIQIVDTEDDQEIYSGPNNTMSVIEALSFYFGIDNIEYEEAPITEAEFQLNKGEIDEDTEIEVVNNGSQQRGTGRQTSFDGDEWLDDDED